MPQISTPASPAAYEKLGAFYLGREIDPQSGADGELLLYDSRDLTTHAVCVGMTGSGKTGLCLAVLEEAALDGVPAIAIDPKGDIANLLLTFPNLAPGDFLPWIDPADAARKSSSVEQLAQATSDTWRKGLSDWQQDGDRIRRLKDAAEVTVYTPGSLAGRPLSVLRSFAAPAPELRADLGALRERIAATVAGLLGLVDIAGDPLKSREHILLSTLLERAWEEGRDLDLEALIQAVQKPAFDKMGVFDLETFYPAKDRLRLAMSLNNLVAAPGFAAWRQGDALDVQKLLYTDSGKPRITILSIAHLSDSERMFVVTLVLGEMVAWMRRQPGTGSLRALIYMDEIFGYFPPSAMPPSKLPLLTLMKQARAFGLGVVLATQNPVDLDYKGLANAGTWFIGRLQTERDKARVVAGLLGASGAGLDEPALERLLADLKPRTFLMRNVNEAAPILFRSRWALSYLKGPLTLAELARLQKPAPGSVSLPSPPTALAPTAPPAAAQKPTLATGGRPVVPAGIPEVFLSGTGTTLSPHVLATVRLHFVQAGTDVWQTRHYLAVPGPDGHVDWTPAHQHPTLATLPSPPAGATFAEARGALVRPDSYTAWKRQLAADLYATATLELWQCPTLKKVSTPGTSEAEFRSQLGLALREKRDAAVDALRRKYAARLQSLQDQVRRGEDRVAREREQLSQQKLSTAISVGSSLLGALLGRRTVSIRNAGRLGTAARSAGRIGRESHDVTRASDSLDQLQARYAALEQELAHETAQLQTGFDVDSAAVEPLILKPRKADIEVTELALAWVPA